jgi:type IV pilus assembly protein PilV
MTLIEVLVALVVISVGLLGIAALQLSSLKANQESYGRTQASVLAGEILDRIRANQREFLEDRYEVALNGTGTAATPSGNDLAAWQASIDRLLPGGSALAGGAIATDVLTGVVTVTIQWSERAQDDTSTAAQAAQTVMFVTRTEI